MTTLRTNLVPNPSSELAASLTAATSCTLARETVAGFAGSNVTKVTASGTAPAATTPPGISGAPVIGGRTYTASLYVRHAAAAGRQLAVQVIWYTSGAAVISTTPASYTTVPNTDAWTRLTTTAAAPANAAYAALRFAASSVVSGEVFRVDALMLEEAAAASAYFDGATATAGLKSYAWTGATHASASVERQATFTAAPLPTLGAVALALADAPPSWNAGLTALTRSIDGGPATAVRRQPGIDIGTFTSGAYTLTDYDVPASAAGKPITYTLTTAAGSITTAPVTFTPAASVLPWTFPEKVLPVPLITGFRHSRSTTDQVHNILGATNPAVTVGDGRPASGSMELWAPTLADALALETLLLLDTAAKGDVFLLRGPVGDPWRLFFKPTRVEVEPASWTAPAGSEGLRWTVRVEFTTMPEQTGPRG